MSKRDLPTPAVVSEWRSRLAGWTGGFLLFETLTGLAIYLLPFSRYTQLSLLLHTILGILFLLPITFYLARHWWVRKRGSLTHYQLLGYVAAGILALCVASGLVVTRQGFTGPRLNATWDATHLLTGLGLSLFVLVHLVTVLVRQVRDVESRQQVRKAQSLYFRRTAMVCAVLLLAGGIWAGMVGEPIADRSFPPDYNWRFGEDRPFAPSMARVDHDRWHKDVQRQVLHWVSTDLHPQFEAAFNRSADERVGPLDRIRECATRASLGERARQGLEEVLSQAADDLKKSGAIAGATLAGSARCGTAGCHTQIYEEWLPSAHRYSSRETATTPSAHRNDTSTSNRMGGSPNASATS
ncbi:MAG: hypothetical protein ACC628_00730 [Pirellulaceae bacterium]